MASEPANDLETVGHQQPASLAYMPLRQRDERRSRRRKLYQLSTRRQDGLLDDMVDGRWRLYWRYWRGWHGRRRRRRTLPTPERNHDARCERERQDDQGGDHTPPGRTFYWPAKDARTPGRYKLVKDVGRQDGFKASTMDVARLSGFSRPWRCLPWCALHKILEPFL